MNISKRQPLRLTNEQRYKDEQQFALGPHLLEEGHPYILRLISNKHLWGNYSADHLVKVNDIDESKPKLAVTGVLEYVGVSLLPITPSLRVIENLSTYNFDEDGMVYIRSFGRMQEAGYITSAAVDIHSMKLGRDNDSQKAQYPWLPPQL